MATANELNLYVEVEENGEGLRVISPNGYPKLNSSGVEIANIRRDERDRIFVFAEPVAIVGLGSNGWYLIQVGPHTELAIDPERDDYFL